MRNTEKGKKHISIFNYGTDYDINTDLGGMRQGFYKDARNMALRDDNAQFNALQKIKGETKIYGTEDITYTCIGS